MLLAFYIDGFPDAGLGRGAPVALADGRTDANATVEYVKPTPKASEGTVADAALSMSAEGQPDSCIGKLTSTAAAKGEYYLCVTVLNNGDVTLSEHTLTTNQHDESVLLESDLAPGDTMTVTAELLDGLGLTSVLGPFPLPEDEKKPIVASVSYEGSGLVSVGDDETTTLTATADVSITVLASAADEASAESLLPTITPTRTPKATATSTPTSTSASDSPLATPTATAIGQSPLAPPPPPPPAPGEAAAAAASLTATAEAAATIVVLDATATAIAGSPLDGPTATWTPLPTISPTMIVVVQATPTPEPTATPVEAAVIVPPAAGPQRPFNTPTPQPTPDLLLTAAEAFDKTLLAATWVWFMAGSLVFFAIAGVLAGLAFWRNERDRYTFVARYPTGAELVADDPFPTPPPPLRSELDDELKDWPESLP